jgi:membrane protein implicated in regulation of membrane protease activity
MIDNATTLIIPYFGYFWLIAGLVLLTLEVGTPGLFIFLSLACGTFVAALSAFCNVSLFVQCWLALGGALISFVILKYFFVGKKQHCITNVQALIGQEAVVIEPIEPRKAGRIKVKGEEWQALCVDPHILQKGTIVKIVRIEGNKLIVK